MKANMKVLFAVIAVGLMLAAPFAALGGVVASDSNSDNNNGSGASNAAIAISGDVYDGAGNKVAPTAGESTVQVIVKYTSGQTTGTIPTTVASNGYSAELPTTVVFCEKIEVSVNTTDEKINGLKNLVYNQQYATITLTNVNASVTGQDLSANTVEIKGKLTDDGATAIKAAGVAINGAEGPVVTDADGNFRFIGKVSKKEAYVLSASFAGVNFTSLYDTTGEAYVLKPNCGTNQAFVKMTGIKAPFGTFTLNNTDVPNPIVTSIGSVTFAGSAGSYVAYASATISTSAGAEGVGTLTHNIQNIMSGNGTWSTVTIDTKFITVTFSAYTGGYGFMVKSLTIESKEILPIEGIVSSITATQTKSDADPKALSVTVGYWGGYYFAFVKPDQGWSVGEVRVNFNIGNYKVEDNKFGTPVSGGIVEGTFAIDSDSFAKVTYIPNNTAASSVKITANDVLVPVDGTKAEKLASGGSVALLASGASATTLFYVPIGTNVLLAYSDECTPSSYSFTADRTTFALPKVSLVIPQTITGTIFVNGLQIENVDTTTDDVCSLKVYKNDVFVFDVKKGATESEVMRKLVWTNDVDTHKSVYSFTLTDTFLKGLKVTDKITVQPVNVTPTPTVGGAYHIEDGKYAVDLKTGIVETMNVEKGTVTVPVAAKLPNNQYLGVSGVKVTLSVYKGTGTTLEQFETSATLVQTLGEVESKNGVATFDVGLYPQSVYWSGTGTGIVLVAEAMGSFVTEYGVLNFKSHVHAYPVVSHGVFAYPSASGPGFVNFEDRVTPVETTYCGHYAGGKTLPGFSLDFTTVIKNKTTGTEKVVTTDKAIIKDGMYFVSFVQPNVDPAKFDVIVKLYSNDSFYTLDKDKNKVRMAEVEAGTDMDVVFFAEKAPIGPVLSIGGSSISWSEKAVVNPEEISPSAAEIIALLPVVLNQSFQQMINTCFWVNVNGTPVTATTNVPLGANVVVGVSKTKIAMPLADIAIELEKHGEDGSVIAKELMKLSFAHDTNLVIDLKDICIVNEKGEVTHADLNKDTKFTMSGPTTIYGKATIGFEKVLDPTPGINPTVLAIGIVAVVIALLAVAFVAFMSVKKNKE